MTYSPQQPNALATRRVKDPFPVPIFCNCCDGPVRIATHKEIYGKVYGKYPWVYLCESCGAYVGMHPETNIPLGTLADAPTRRARTACKPAFEKLWKGGDMTRTEAYKWLSERMGLTEAQCHFGLFTEAQCKKAYSICEEYLHG